MGTPQQQPTWYFDPQNVMGTSSDSNDGLSPGTALRTYGKILDLWGTDTPSLWQDTSITALSSHVDNTDPIQLSPYLFGGARCLLTSSLTQVATGTLSGVVTLTRSTGQLWQASFPAGTVVGSIVVNSTNGGVAHIYKDLGGGVFSFSRPLPAASVPSTIVPPSSLITWNNGDTVIIYSPCTLNIVETSPTVVDLNSSSNNWLYVYRVHGMQPSGDSIYSSVYSNYFTRFYECTLDRPLAVYGTAVNSGWLFNCNLTCGGYISGNTTTLAIYGGIIQAAHGAIAFGGNSFAFQCDPIIDINVTWGAPLAAGSQFGTAYIESGKTLIVQGTAINGTFNSDGGNSVLWGPGKLSLKGQCRWNYSGLAVNCFQNTGGIVMNNSSTAYSTTSSGGVVSLFNGIPLTSANLDGLAGPTGFGGLAFNPGGACITNQGQ